MARQGLLAQSKPLAATDTLLYSAPVDTSASAVLKIANDGTGSAYSVALRDYDQDLVLDSSSYLLHKGDIVTSYRVSIDTAVSVGSFTPGAQFVSSSGESTMKFESFYVPPLTTIYVKTTSIRVISLELVDTATGEFNVGDTVSKGVAPDNTDAVIYDVNGDFITIGPSTINGLGTEFVDGDAITSSSTASGTIAAGGISATENKFIFSETTVGGTYSRTISDLFSDRVYRFDVSDTSMTGLLFALSETENGEWGPDGLAPTDPNDALDGGIEYTIGKTTNGTAGSGGAYVQYDMAANTSLPTSLFWYETDLTTAANASYGGGQDSFSTSSEVTYTEFYAYDLDGTWTNNVDSFEDNFITYTVEGQTSGPYGVVSDYTGTSLKIILGVGSAEFAGSNTFFDVPKSNTADRNTVTVSSVTTAKSTIAADSYLVDGNTNSANNTDTVTSLVVGPGQRVHVNSVTANNVFSLIGFEDGSSEYTTRVYGQT
ncbi:structural protein [Synechococcus phage S-RIM8]|uniref:Structural protein n=1 Tax=Synechococcus phage S-RIM8 TaxID=756278 RepID=A0A1D7S9Q1_9CAUD|nr:structural protein [Synechococcus phage S-RIM8]